MTIKTQLAIYLILPVLFAACKTIDPTPIVEYSGIKLEKLATYNNRSIYNRRPQFAADGKIAVAVAGNGLLFLDPNTGKESTKIDISNTTIKGEHLSNNGMALVVTGRSTQLWNLRKHEKLREWNESVSITESAMSINGQYTLIGDQHLGCDDKTNLGKSGGNRCTSPYIYFTR